MLGWALLGRHFSYYFGLKTILNNGLHSLSSQIAMEVDRLMRFTTEEKQHIFFHWKKVQRVWMKT
jgi:hypothetical protein